ncbi:hypothetical protein [Phenylobacterium sp.]|uniref:hypothetical protein n=1 Tax=Phenylobacterium sp. TaxID=1871053 RepID=UPI002FCAC3AE
MSLIAHKLYVPRLRQRPLAVVRLMGHTWQRHRYTVRDRAEEQAREFPRPLTFPHPKVRWRDEGYRESPREELMSYRGFGVGGYISGHCGRKRRLRDLDHWRQRTPVQDRPPHKPMYLAVKEAES